MWQQFAPRAPEDVKSNAQYLHYPSHDLSERWKRVAPRHGRHAFSRGPGIIKDGALAYSDNATAVMCLTTLAIHRN
jgi:hypothetical protein